MWVVVIIGIGMKMDLSGKSFKNLMYILEIKGSYHNALLKELDAGEQSDRLRSKIHYTWFEIQSITNELKRRTDSGDLR